VMSSYRGRPLGSLGTFGAYSFHETKNVISGEGGALLVNDPRYAEPAEIIREKGTDRSRFLRGTVDKYTWREVGSSFLPGEITAAFLYAQLVRAEWLTAERMRLWARYHERFADLERGGLMTRPHVPPDCAHNAHMYYIVVRDARQRGPLLDSLKQDGINAVFHYVPLHSSPGGLRFGRTCGELRYTDDLSTRLVRLPLWIGLSDDQIDFIVERIAFHLMGTSSVLASQRSLARSVVQSERESRPAKAAGDARPVSRPTEVPWPALFQLLRYGVVGLLTNLAGYLVYLLVTWLWLEPKAAVTLLYPVGMILGYFGHARYSFAFQGRTNSGVARYFVAHAIGYGANVSLLYVFTELLHFPHQVVQACAIFVVAGILFLLFRYFVFPSAHTRR